MKYFLVLFYFSASVAYSQKQFTLKNSNRNYSDTIEKVVLLQVASDSEIVYLISYFTNYDTIVTNVKPKIIQLRANYGYYIKRTYANGRLITRNIINSIKGFDGTSSEEFGLRSESNYVSSITFHKMVFANKDTGIIYLTDNYIGYGENYDPYLIYTSNGGKDWDTLMASGKDKWNRPKGSEDDFHMFTNSNGILFMRPVGEDTSIEYYITRNGGTNWEKRTFTLSPDTFKGWKPPINILSINYSYDIYNNYGSVLLTFNVSRLSSINTAGMYFYDEKAFIISSRNFGNDFSLLK